MSELLTIQKTTVAQGVKGLLAEETEIIEFAGGTIRIFRNIASSMTSTILVTSEATLMIGFSTVG